MNRRLRLVDDGNAETTGQPPATSGKLLWSVTEASSATGISRSALYELIAAGELPSVKVGARRYFIPADIAAWVESLRDVG